MRKPGRWDGSRWEAALAARPESVGKLAVGLGTCQTLCSSKLSGGSFPFLGYICKSPTAVPCRQMSWDIRDRSRAAGAILCAEDRGIGEAGEGPWPHLRPGRGAVLQVPLASTPPHPVCLGLVGLQSWGSLRLFVLSSV